MLTEAEKKWLEERKQYIQRFYSETFCKYCYYFNEIPKGWACDADICPTDRRDHDYEDAAEFEARVSAKLASTLRPCENCPDFLQAPRCPALGLRPYYCMLRNARLAVEAEMEQEGR